MKRGPKLFLTLLVIFAIIIIAMILMVQIFQIVIVKKVYGYVVQNFINVSGMSPWLAKGLIILLLIPFVWAILEITRLMPRIRMPFSKKKVRSYRKLGVFVIISYIALFFISMFFLSRGTYFGHVGGEVMKYYAITPEGLRFFDSPGFDPKYGIELKPVTPKMIDQYERSNRGMHPKQIEISKETEFFDTITGEPKVWFYIDKEGNYEFYDQPGFHPVYWEELKPVTKNVILAFKEKIKKTEIEQKEIEAEKAKKKRRQEDIARRRVYIEKYVNPIISNIAERVEISVLIIDEKKQDLSSSSILIADKLSQSITIGNKKGIFNLFRQEFIKNGNFKDLYQGNTNDIFNLNLKKNADYIVLGKKESSFSEDPRLGDLISCTLDLNLKIFSSQTGEIISTESFESAGVGVNNEKAEQQAINRIIKDVESFILNKVSK